MALAGAAFGSAVCGLRPVVEIMFGDFMALAMDSLVNQSAKYWFVSNEQAPVPLVIRCAVGGGGRFGAMHSQTPATWLQSIAGLKIVAPAFPDDARGPHPDRRRSATRTPSSCSSTSVSTRSRVEVVGANPVAIGVGPRWCGEGSDVTIVSAHARRARRARGRRDAGRVGCRRRGDRPAQPCARSIRPSVGRVGCSGPSRLPRRRGGAAARRVGERSLVERCGRARRWAISTTCGR